MDVLVGVLLAKICFLKKCNIPSVKFALFICRVLDVVTGVVQTVVRTEDDIEYFGSYNGKSATTPQTASGFVFARDVMAKSIVGEHAYGSVQLGCTAHWLEV